LVWTRGGASSTTRSRPFLLVVDSKFVIVRDE
jgi:hypothetical protein